MTGLRHREPWDEGASPAAAGVRAALEDADLAALAAAAQHAVAGEDPGGGRVELDRGEVSRGLGPREDVAHEQVDGSDQARREALEHRSLYATLQSLGVNLKIAHQRISARLMTDDEAELLDEEVPSACLTVDRITYDDTGRFVPIAARPNRGLGLRLTEELASEVEITTRERGTTVALEKDLPARGSRLEDPDEKQDDHD